MNCVGMLRQFIAHKSVCSRTELELLNEGKDSEPQAVGQMSHAGASHTIFSPAGGSEE